MKAILQYAGKAPSLAGGPSWVFTETVSDEIILYGLECNTNILKPWDDSLYPNGLRFVATEGFNNYFGHLTVKVTEGKTPVFLIPFVLFSAIGGSPKDHMSGASEIADQFGDDVAEFRKRFPDNKVESLNRTINSNKN